jgi:hypothetical protein
MATVQDNIHALSQIKTHPKSSSKLIDSIEAIRAKKVEPVAFDAIAVLLVFKPTSDAVAVTQWRTTEEVKILWAKDQPVTNPAQLAYIDKILQMSLHGIEITEILPLVIDMCKDKILHGIDNLSKSLKDEMQQPRNLWGFNGDLSTHREFRNGIRSHMLFKGRPFVTTLDRFTRTVAHTARLGRRAEVQDFVQILFLSYAITATNGHTKRLGKILPHDKVKCLRMLGDYMRSLWLIHQLLKRLRRVNMKVKVTVEQVLTQAIPSLLANRQ